MIRGRQVVRRLLLSRGFELTRVMARTDGTTAYSEVEEHIYRLLAELQVRDRHCVDIAAADGKQGSNTYALFRDHWLGLAVEADEHMFRRLAINYATLPAVQLHRGFVTPQNVESLITAAGIPESFGFLSLDIDGYDYDVLLAILSTFRPALMCVEINEKIPPPVRFAVRYSPEFVYRSGACYGMSLAALEDLRREKDYVIIDLWYNNALLAPAECGRESLDMTVAYKQGYIDRADRLEKLPWNLPFEVVQKMAPAEIVEFLNELPEFAQNRKHYDIS